MVYFLWEENLLSTDNSLPNDKGYELIAERLNLFLAEQVLPELDNMPNMVNTEVN
jgi:lysophospholipase L1-like esterase